MNYHHYRTDDFLNDESFQAYALGVDPKNELFWKDWLLENPQKQEEAQEAKSLLTSFSIKTLDVEIEKYDVDFLKLQNAISEKKKGKYVSLVKNFDLLWKVAASILIFLGLAYELSHFSTTENDTKEITILEKSNPKGRKSTVMLPDGSRVKLNADSYFKYEEIGDKRNVYLKGEAFFEVSKDVDRPFIVYSDDISTRALGTSFNVRAYPEDPVTHIYLATGQVEVKTNKKDRCTKLILEPGNGACFYKNEQRLSLEDFDLETTLAWKEGVIIFEKSDLMEVKKSLERWYGVDIEVVGAPDSSWRINGSFKNESLENILNSIDFTTPIDYSITNKKVKIIF